MEVTLYRGGCECGFVQGVDVEVTEYKDVSNSLQGLPWPTISNKSYKIVITVLPFELLVEQTKLPHNHDLIREINVPYTSLTTY